MKLNSCRICKSKKLSPFFDLGKQPLANALLQSPSEKEKSYPLALVYCQNCSLVQLDYTVDPAVLFTNYFWVTKTSQTANIFAEKFYQKTVKRTKKISKKNIIEIGSNDGTFLVPFKKAGFSVLGIDPAQNIVETANKNNIPTKALFFSNENAKKIVMENGTAGIVCARNVLPHVANTTDFVQGLSNLLAPDGVLVIEVHYAKTILEELHYDSIYHEHLCYFTLQPLENLLTQCGLFTFDISESPISGGSIIIYASKTKKPESKTLQNFRIKEQNDKVNTLASWKEFAKRARKHKKKFTKLIADAQKKGKVFGYGASARSSTLLNYCGISSKDITVIADKNPLKQGLYAAGSHILIDTPKHVLSEKPDFVVLLAWNFVDEILDSLKNEFHFCGSCIVPLPHEPYVVKV